MEIYVFTWVAAFLEQPHNKKDQIQENHAKKLFHFSSEIRIHLINSYCWSVLFIWINVRVHGEFFQSLASEFIRKKNVLALERTKLLSHKQWMVEYSDFQSSCQTQHSHLQFHETALIIVLLVFVSVIQL